MTVAVSLDALPRRHAPPRWRATIAGLTKPRVNPAAQRSPSGRRDGRSPIGAGPGGGWCSSPSPADGWRRRARTRSTAGSTAISTGPWAGPGPGHSVRANRTAPGAPGSGSCSGPRHLRSCPRPSTSCPRAWRCSPLLFYVFVYTIAGSKRSSMQNIVISGAAGAIPPLVGWAAVTRASTSPPSSSSRWSSTGLRLHFLGVVAPDQERLRPCRGADAGPVVQGDPPDPLPDRRRCEWYTC